MKLLEMKSQTGLFLNFREKQEMIIDSQKNSNKPNMRNLVHLNEPTHERLLVKLHSKIIQCNDAKTISLKSRQ